MIIQAKRQKEPSPQKPDTAIPTKRQTRSAAAEARHVEADAKDCDKELKYYLGLEVSAGRVDALATSSARAQHAKEVRGRMATSMAKLQEIVSNVGNETKPDIRTREEMLHDIAVIDAQSRNFR
jgi:hypothetical protein